MKKFLLLAIAAISLFFLPSCETDVDVNAEWEEITVVYGLLNQLDTAHYFRINKAFLGGNALEIAKIEDSSSYNGKLEVKLEGWRNGSLMQTIQFDTTTIYNKNDGIFYNPRMVVYEGTGMLNEAYEYRLFVKNTVSGHEVSAATQLIHNFSITKPTTGGRVSFNPGWSTPFVWNSAVNGKRYEPMLRIHYWEVPLNSPDTIAKYVDWVLPTQIADDASGYGQEEVSISNDAFYDVMQKNLDPDFVGRRLAGPVDFIVAAGGLEYDTYMRVNGPSYSLVQDRPEYTNVKGGFGLMSSRYQILRTKRLSPITEEELIAMDLSFVKNPGL